MRLSEVADGGTREASATPAYQLHAVLPRSFPHPPSPTPHFSGSGGSTPPPPLTEVTAPHWSPRPEPLAFSHLPFLMPPATNGSLPSSETFTGSRLPSEQGPGAAPAGPAWLCSFSPIPHPPHTHPSCFTRPSLPRVPLGRLCLHPNALRPSAGVPGRLVEPLPP